MLSRRTLLSTAVRCVPAAGLCLVARDETVAALNSLGTSPSGPAVLRSAAAGVRARYWATAATPGVGCLACHRPDERLDKAHAHDASTVTCLLCAQQCVIQPGARGRCRARENAGGELRSLVYGRPVAVHVDPIEKKPFYHFLPGASAYSLATTGCPLRCRFCQNWELSQASPEDFDVPFVGPSEIVTDAERRGARVIAFTYNEPTVFTEYLVDIATAARARGLKSVLVSCGFMQEAPLSDMCRVLDAIKIDLKGFSEAFYRDVSGAELQPVLRSIRQVATSGVHLEIVNLVVPTLNDDERSLRELARWVAHEVGPDVPVHFTRFHPDYQMRNLSPTPIATLERARAIATDAGIRYAYVGNVPGHPGNDTYCPRCGKAVVRRQSFFVTERRLSNGRCGYCGEAIAGVW